VSETPRLGRPSEYPNEIRSVHIDDDMQTFIAQEMERRRGLIAMRRARNSVIRDTLRFAIAHRSLFLSWVTTDGELSTGGKS
jgi:hypothetical protein